jgi:mono/diheme cytochrome c family protein
MKTIARVVWLAALVFPGASVFAQSRPSADSALSTGMRLDAEGGAAVYAHVCAACHQPDGRGATGAGAYPALLGNERAGSSDYVLSVVLHGLRGMPPVGGMMSDAQVADVVNYVRANFAHTAGDPVSAAEVKADR